LLNWSQATLAANAGIARKTIADFEAGKRHIHSKTHYDIAEALTLGGAIFLWPDDGEGNEGVSTNGRPALRSNLEK
jgi:DNA-binding XRE family transcriptional regulator